MPSNTVTRSVPYEERLQTSQQPSPVDPAHRVLVLGATGRAGSAVIRELPEDAQVVAAVREGADAARLPAVAGRVEATTVDLAHPDSIGHAAHDVDVIVNAIRLRDDIPPDALIDLHESIRAAAPDDARTVTVGGAGALRMPDGRRFWEDPAFPARTLPRGRAHARLRDHLESGNAGVRWTYLIPPPVFDPDGARTGRFSTSRPASDESTFARTGAIGYADFAVAAVRTLDAASGTLLVHGA